MAGTWTWIGTTDDPSIPSNWTLTAGSSGSTPQPGDTVTFPGGTTVPPLFVDSSFTDANVNLINNADVQFNNDGSNPDNSGIDNASTINTFGTATTLSIAGPFTNAGLIDVTGTHDSLSIQLTAGSSAAGELINTGQIVVNQGDSLVVAGGTLESPSGITVNGAALVSSALTGLDNFAVGSGGSLELTQAGASALTEITFTGTTGAIKLDTPTAFVGGINDFALGDTLDLGVFNVSTVIFDGAGDVTMIGTNGTFTASDHPDSSLNGFVNQSTFTLPGTGGLAGDLKVTEGSGGDTVLTALPPSTWMWKNGVSGSGDNSADWTLISGPGNGFGGPQTGDTAIDAGGTINFGSDPQLQSNTLELGGTAGAAVLTSTGDHFVNLNQPALDQNSVLTSAVPGNSTAETSALDAAGYFVNEGSIIADGPAGSTFTIAISSTVLSGTFTPGYFTNYGEIAVDGGNAMTILVGGTSELFNAGYILVNGGSLFINVSSASLGGGYSGGGGVIAIADGGTVETNVGYPSNDSLGMPVYQFFDATAGNTLKIDNIGSFGGVIAGFGQGDTIDLGTSLSVSQLVYNGAIGVLSLENAGGTILASLSTGGNFQSGTFAVSGGTADGFILSTGADGDTLLTTNNPVHIYNNSGTVWQTATAWTNGVPGTLDAAYIGTNATAPFTLTTGNVPVAAGALVLGSEDATLQITSPTKAGPYTSRIYAGTLEVTSGNTLTLPQINAYGGTVELDANSVLDVTGHANYASTGAVNGTIIASNSGTNGVAVFGGTLLVNGATLDAGVGQSGGDGGKVIVGLSGSSPSATVIVQGTALNPAVVTDTYTILGSDPESSGTLTLSGNASWTDEIDPHDPTIRGFMFVGYDIQVGNTGSLTPPPASNAASLLVENGATLTEQAYAEIGATTDSGGSVTVQGAGALWNVGFNNGGFLEVGASATGSLNVQDGGTVEVGNFATFITTGTAISGGGLLAGYNSGATGVVTVGPGGTLIDAGEAVIGRNGSGTLSVQGGTVSLGTGGTILPFSLDAGEFGGSFGDVVVSGPGALLSGTGDFRIGDAGNGSLYVSSGATVNVGGTLYVSPGFGVGNVIVDGAAMDTGFAVIGSNAAGLLTVRDGGSLLDNGGMIIGDGPSQSGTVTVTGSGSSLTVNGSGIAVGDTENGLLTVQNQGSVDAASLAVGGTIGGPLNGRGTVALTGTSDLGVTGNAAVWSQSTLSVDGSSAIDVGGNNFTPGSVSIEGGHTLTGSGTVKAPVINNGTILAIGTTGAGGGFFPQATLEITGSVSGSGWLDVGPQGVLRLDGSIGSGQNIGFGSGGGEVIISQPGTALTNFVGGLSLGDKIDFNFASNVFINSASITGTGTIALSLSNGTTYDLTSVSFAAGAPQLFYWFSDFTNGSEFQAIEVAPNQYSWTGTAPGDQTNLSDIGNWFDSTTNSAASSLPNANTTINFNNNPGTLTGSVTAASVNFNSNINNFSTWVLQGATLNIPGDPSPPFSNFGGNFDTNVVLNASTINAGNATFNIDGTNGATVTATGGSKVVTLGDSLGNNSGQSGSLVLTGAGTTWQEQTGANDAGNGGGINIGLAGIFSPGQAGGTGYLTVTNSATLITATNAALGQNVGDIGGATVSANGVWSVGSGGMQIGGSGLGTLGLGGGTVISTGFVGIGNNTGGSGTVTVSPGSAFTVNGLNVGGSGSGVMSVAGATVTNKGGFAIGGNPGGFGTLALSSGGTLLNAAFASIGQGTDSTGIETLGTGALMTDSGLNVGGAGAGYLTINGGTVTSAPTLSAGTLVGGGVSIGGGIGGEGSVAVTGAGHFDMNGLSVGGSGPGTLTLSGTSEITDSSGFTVGSNAGAVGIATVAASTVTVAANTVIGNSGDGTLTVNGGGTILANGTFDGVGNNAGSFGELQINSGGHFVSAATSMAVGSNAGSSGDLIVTAGGTLQFTEPAQDFTQALRIGASGASGTLAAAQGDVLVTGAGALINAGNNAIAVGNGGVGNLTVSSGGSVVAGTPDSSEFYGLAIANNGGSGAVTVTGAGSTLTVNGYLLDGRGGAGSLTIENSGEVVVNDAPLDNSGVGIGAGRGAGPSSPSNVGGDGVALVTSGGVLDATSTVSGMAVGGDGVDGALTVNNGGTVLTGGGLTVGTATEATGTIYGGTGELTIGAGGTVLVNNPVATNGYDITIGNANSDIGATITGTATGAASGEATVSGPGALLNANGFGIAVGWLSNGELTISQGATVLAGTTSEALNQALSIGRRADGSVTITDPGSVFRTTGGVYAGRAGNGSLTIENQASLIAGLDPNNVTGISIGGTGLGLGITSGVTYLATGGSGSGLVTSGGYMFSQMWLKVGTDGTDGTLAVDQGGTAEAATQIIVGDSTVVAGGDTIITPTAIYVTNSDTLLTTAGVLDIGPGGLVKSDGPHVSGTPSVIVGAGTGASGTVNVTGGGAAPVLALGVGGIGGGALVVNPAILSTGGDPLMVGQFGEGSVLVSQGGTVLAGTTFTHDEAITLGGSVGSTGGLTVTDDGSLVQAVGQVDVGGAGSGSLLVENGATVVTGHNVVDANEGFDVAASAGSSGSATVSSDATLSNTGTFVVGDGGIGSLNIQSGGVVITSPGTTGAAAVVGNQASAGGSSVQVTGAGSDWQINGALIVGNAGAGALNIAAGGAVTATSVDLAAQSGSSGDLSLSGTATALTTSGSLAVGDAGAGELSILNGASVTIGGDLDVGQLTNGSGNVDIENASVSVAGNLNLGLGGGAGVVTVGTGGTLHVTGGLIGGIDSALNEFGAVDPNFDDGVNANVGVSGTQDFPGYIDGFASFTIDAGVTLTLESPSVYNNVSFVMGGKRDTTAAVLVLNTGSVSADTTVAFTNAHDTLVLGINALQTIDIQANDSAAATFVANPSLGVPSIAQFLGMIDTFKAGDQIVVDTTAAATFMLNGSTVEVVQNLATIGALSFDSAANAQAAFNSGLVDVSCFAAGTWIRTVRGEVRVEELLAGDVAITAIDGSEAPVVWVGHREVDCARHPDPASVWPVRISAGAFGRGLPKRALTLSPDHAVYVNDVLVPVKHLINGTTIRQVQVDRVTYYHVELDRHDVVYADGMPAESYLDVGDRGNFANGGAVVRLHIDLAHHWEAGGCAPLVVWGEELEGVRAVVAQQARPLRLPRSARGG